MWKITFLLLFMLSSGLDMPAQSVAGTWKTVDDRDKKSKSHVEIYEQEGKMYGRITLLLQDPPDAKCKSCKGTRKNQALLGMIVIEGLEQIKQSFGNGRIYDPTTGHDYKCTIWIEPAKPEELKVKGTHWSGIFRTQTWYKVSE